ncbi:hypothetical protein L596_023776 [Steinernema carpocapsae]|uniref:Uncharacterized protein n=1 Tax=Steinernema carpocapsae TaxID=34508 RepID=A0A4U5MEP4_STECR|nr:hypothetical protein L596_023776 [Steinernema carpocapsae]
MRLSAAAEREPNRVEMELVPQEEKSEIAICAVFLAQDSRQRDTVGRLLLRDTDRPTGATPETGRYTKS